MKYKIRVNGIKDLSEVSQFLESLGYNSLMSMEERISIARYNGGVSDYDYHEVERYVYVLERSFCLGGEKDFGEYRLKRKYRTRSMSVCEFKMHIMERETKKVELFSRFDAYLCRGGIKELNLTFSSLDNNGYIYFTNKETPNINFQVRIKSGGCIGNELTWDGVKNLEFLEDLYILVIRGKECDTTILFGGSFNCKQNNC